MKSKKTNPTFSIITVVYNDVKNIEETIKSVLNQTYKDFEYIIIDGKSDDGTVEKIKKYDKEIDYWVSEKDGGIYDAMNKGIKKSKGELLFFLNSNDFFYNKDVLKNIAKQYLKNNKPDILYGRAYLKFPEKNKKKKILSQPFYKQRLKSGFGLCHQTTFVKKSVFEKIGIFDLKYSLAGDYDFFCRCFLKNLEFNHINDIVTIFTTDGKSSNFEALFLEKKEIVKKYFGDIGFLKYFVVRRWQNVMKKCLGFRDNLKNNSFV